MPFRVKWYGMNELYQDVDGLLDSWCAWKLYFQVVWLKMNIRTCVCTHTLLHLGGIRHSTSTVCAWWWLVNRDCRSNLLQRGKYVRCCFDTIISSIHLWQVFPSVFGPWHWFVLILISAPTWHSWHSFNAMVFRVVSHACLLFWFFAFHTNPF